jgi:RNA polymerase sigma-70 factor (ECF subfamily)
MRQGLKQIDLEMIERALAGDRGSLESIARLTQERVFPYINRMMLDEDCSHDLTQETLLAILESLDRLQQTDRFWPWAFRIAANKTRQHLRKRTRHRTLLVAGFDDYSTDTSGRPCSGARPSDVGDTIGQAEICCELRTAMDGLNDRYRTALSMRFFDRKRHSEIAKALGCTELNARAILFRAKQALRRALGRRGVNGTALAA